MLNTKFSPWPYFTPEEIDAVSAVLRSNRVNYWTGSECRKFEEEFAEWIGAKYAIALANGTLALDAALKAIDIQPGDEVVVTPRSFMASVSCVVTAGAVPVFADVDLNSQNLTADSIERVITNKTKAIIVVHLAGMPAEMDDIMKLADTHDLKVIEDCAQAHGATYKGRAVGTIGHIGAWSFCQDKIMTTGGEGGMVTTNIKDYWRKMWSYKDHGKDYEIMNSKAQTNGFRWVHTQFGTNWRMLEIQAAIGRIQLKRIDEWSRIRRLYAAEIDKAAMGYKFVRTVNVPNHIEHAEYKHYIFIENEFLPSGWDRNRIISEISNFGVPCYHGSCSEIYLESAFDGTSYRPAERLQNAKRLGESSVMFLVHPTLTNDEIGQTCHAISNVFREIVKSIE